ncbi:MAG: NAD-dependent epimerase/dehydratase family protein [Chitinispirillales bacterium]|jgi:nucleoside-diphosphate-sugar epimerase|nr:NAD-dependent epimerase/dehydratase family protein [Chitinispirillales bacterium]
MRRIVVNGATSMIGASIVRCALAQGSEVLCIVRNDSARMGNIPKSERVTVARADLDDYASLEIEERYDEFYHVAWGETASVAHNDVDTQERNIRGTLSAAYLAHRVGCSVFVGAGSQAEYGIVNEPLRPDTPANPQSGYGVAKYAAGKLSALLCEQLGIRHNWIRLLSIFGPQDRANMLIVYAVRELLAGRSPEVTKCEQIWDYLYCDDAAKAFLAVGKSGVAGKAYPLGSGKPRRLFEYLEALRGIVNPDGALQFGKRGYYRHQPMHLCADISELAGDTGWKPEVSFEDGVRKVVEGIRSEAQ